MPAFFDEIEPFLGDGSKNEAGETLEEFLEKYDPYKYRNPCSTVDMVVFSYSGEMASRMDQMKVLLIKRKNHPSIGTWAMPGGFVNLRENLEDAAKRELYEETGVKGIRAEQIGAFGDVKRDPRARVITSAYMSVVREQDITVCAGDDAKEAAWFRIAVQKKKEEDEADLFTLFLENEEFDIHMQPVVRMRSKGDLIRERTWEILDACGTASDHAVIILQAYLTLEERLGTLEIEKKRRNNTDEME
ncbi:NUDIX domain-containing protein [Sellimonas caecigallum]|uniref:NUDIX hydrolase n=1 Tax=Sellimonas caecigallum TaxID=2592333 RepID=A0ABS7L3I5_9FIRM|nr:NUDIX hydrolase [Sellimonas caecigallum]MBY0757590.1 NUDIX hydrolase [Sellimonas caecigallum]